MCRPIAFVKVRERFPALSSIYDEAYLRQAIMPSGPVESIDEPDCLPRLEELGQKLICKQEKSTHTHTHCVLMPARIDRLHTGDE